MCTGSQRYRIPQRPAALSLGLFLVLLFPGCLPLLLTCFGTTMKLLSPNLIRDSSPPGVPAPPVSSLPNTSGQLTLSSVVGFLEILSSLDPWCYSLLFLGLLFSVSFLGYPEELCPWAFYRHVFPCLKPLMWLQPPLVLACVFQVCPLQAVFMFSDVYMFSCALGRLCSDVT